MSSARNFRAMSALEQPIAVLREHRRHPYRLVHAEPDEPTIEKVIIELLNELPFRPDRIERLQQKRPQQPLGRYRRPPTVRVGIGKIAVERSQNFVHDRSHKPQRVLRRNPLLEVHVGK